MRLLNFILIACCGFAQAQTVPNLSDGFDWSLPGWSGPKDDLRLYSESASPAHQVHVHALELTWRQLNPQPGVFARNLPGSAAGLTFDSLDQQLARPGAFWLRLWVSGVDWAPDWVVQDCNISQTWPDQAGQTRHLPIWDPCIWGHLKTLYRTLWRDWGLLAEPRLQFTHVPGAFYYTEFDFDIPFQAAQAGQLDFATFDTWFHQAMADLVNIANGENSDPDDDLAWKLVYTGEDYPFDDVWNGATNLFARDAVNLGMGLRNGITELFNFHLNHAPAWGVSIQPDGHIAVDEDHVARWGRRTVAAENECFNHCGYSTTDTEYAVRMANLKALQMRVNRLYVVPSDSYMDDYPQHWNWVLHQLGRDRIDAPEAWVFLRSAQDLYWDPLNGDNSHSWADTPWVRNLERWLVQSENAPECVSRAGTGSHAGELATDNGQSVEGRRTDLASGGDRLCFVVDPVFVRDDNLWSAKITFIDNSTGTWQVEYQNAQGTTRTATVQQTGTGRLRTATLDLPGILFNTALSGGADLVIHNLGSADIEVRMLRLVRKQAPLTRLWRDGFEAAP